MNGSHVYQYFPSECYKNTGQYRNMFSSYGQMNHLQIYNGGSECKRAGQRVIRCPASAEFRAYKPSMPLFPPVDLGEYDEEPCFQLLREENERCKQILKLNIDKKKRRGVLPRESMIEIHKQEVNYMYTGGALKYQNWLTPGTEGILFYPQGPEGTSLATVEIHERQGGAHQKGSMVKSAVTSSDRIYEIDTVLKDGNILCLTRGTDTVGISLLEQDQQEKYCRKLLKRTVEKKGSELTSAALCPFQMHEYVKINSNGDCALKHIGRKGSLITTQCKQRFDCLDPYWQCSWGMHPRELVIADRSGVALYDIRRLSAVTHSDIFKLPHASLNPKERVFVRKQHSKSPYYHFIATSYNLILIDQRFPNHPVLKWNHLLLSPPVYMDIVYDVTNGNSVTQGAAAAETNQIEDVVFLGCQDYPECHAFRLSVGSGEVHPAWQGLPWRISKPSDFAAQCSYGSLDAKDGYQARLSAPLAGITAFRHGLDNGFTCFQMTSYNDIFYQTYSTSACDEKTRDTSPASSDVTLNDKDDKLACRWLIEAEKHGRQQVISYPDSGSTYLEHYIDGFEKCKMTAHVGCQLCKSSVRTTSCGDFCPRCENDVELSQLLCDSLFQVEQKPLPHIVPYSTSQRPALDYHLREIDIDKVKNESALSTVITKLWNREEAMDDKLLRRCEKEFLEANPKIKAQLIKKEIIDPDVSYTSMDTDAASVKTEDDSAAIQPPVGATGAPRDLASLLNIDLTQNFTQRILTQDEDKPSHSVSRKSASFESGSMKEPDSDTIPESEETDSASQKAGRLNTQADLFLSDHETTEQSRIRQNVKGVLSKGTEKLEGQNETINLFDWLQIEPENSSPRKRTLSRQESEQKTKRVQNENDISLEDFAMSLFSKEISHQNG